MDTRERIKGCMFGQAIGDALGVGTEFMTKEEVNLIYQGGLKHYKDITQDSWRMRFDQGDWTDDTDMALCIIGSYGQKGYVDLQDIAETFYEWYHVCVDAGFHVSKVLTTEGYLKDPLETSFRVWKKRGPEKSAGNGGIMRASVCGLFKEGEIDIEKHAADICRLTHWDPRCVGSSVIVAKIISALVWEDRLYNSSEIIEIGEKYDPAIKEYVELAAKGDLEALDLDEPGKAGYTLKTLSAALWSYWFAKDFEDGLIKIVNEGGDADTNAAPSCAILGCKFGFNTIPSEYVEGLIKKDLVQRFYEAL